MTLSLVSEPASAVEEAAAIISEGGIVAFPTETYYGLAVDPFNRQALERLFALKQRPFSKPVLTIIENQAQLSTITTGIPPRFNSLMARFWPGPLTLIFNARPELPARITAGSGTIGARISSHPLAHALVMAVGRPITATSANRSGQPPALDAVRLRAVFGGGLDYILDGGLTPGGQGSTIVGCQGDELRLLRPGVLTVTCSDMAIGGINMRTINLKLEGEAVDYRRAAESAKSRAEREMPEAMLIAWNDRQRDIHSPSCLKCEIKNEAGWEVYGRNHGGCLRISVNDDDFVFIYGML